MSKLGINIAIKKFFKNNYPSPYSECVALDSFTSNYFEIYKSINYT